jgi:hypothetical protein
MALVQNYNVGGVIDEIKKVNWPAHLFPRKTKPFLKGLRLEVPAIDDVYMVTYTCSEEMELVNVSIACSGYKDTDEWELVTIAPGEPEYKVVETMPTRELAESINMGHHLYIVHRLPAGSIIKFLFYNKSATSKIVWPSMRFLR